MSEETITITEHKLKEIISDYAEAELIEEIYKKICEAGVVK